MASADDEFDIDIYGDTNGEQEQDGDIKKDEEGDVKIEGFGSNADETTAVNGAGANGTKQEEAVDDYVEPKLESTADQKMNDQQQIKSTDESGRDILNIPRHKPQEQGVKRKAGSDDRPVDPGATTALMISDLNWWNTDDDVRGWVNQAMVEDELKEITFSEHKVNGKSKGQAYVEFSSQQAATAAKHKIDAFGEGQQYVKKHSVTYSNPNVNPFRTLPKDAPARAPKDGQSNRGGSNDYAGNRGGNFGGNFRGRTPGYNANNRGGMNNMNNNNYNRNFSGPGMNNMGGGFNPAMGGFGGNAMGGQFGGGFNRGGMMGGMRGGPNMRGGRGGMGNGMMGGMNMGGMPMGGMGGMPMMGQMGGMPGMTPTNVNVGGPQSSFQAGTLYSQAEFLRKFPPPSGLQGSHPSTLPASSPPLQQHSQTYLHNAGAGGFQGMQPHFNPAFFPNNQAGGGDWQNPHGAKRPRPE